jgi:hypothetical protein
MSSLIFLDTGEVLNLKKRITTPTPKSGGKQTDQRQRSIPETADTQGHLSGGTKTRSPLSSPSDSSFVILKRITSPEQMSRSPKETTASMTGIGAAVPQPAPSVNQPPVLSSPSAATTSTTSPRSRILPYTLRSTVLPQSSPTIGAQSISAKTPEPVSNPVTLADSDAGTMKRPLLIRSPQVASYNDNTGPRLAILNSPLSNSPILPARQARLPHSALSPTAQGEAIKSPSSTIQEEDVDKQNQLIRKINERERELGVSISSQTQPVPKIFSHKMQSFSGISSIDDLSVEANPKLPRPSHVKSGNVDVKRDDNVLMLLKQLKIDLNSQLEGIL